LPIGESKSSEASESKEEWIFFYKELEIPFTPFIGLEFAPHSSDINENDFLCEQIQRIEYSIITNIFYCHIEENTAIKEEITELIEEQSKDIKIAESLISAVDDYINYYQGRGWELNENSIGSINKVLNRYYSGDYTYSVNK